MQHIISSSPILLLTSRALAGMGLPLARIVIDAGRKKININWRVLDLGNLKKTLNMLRKSFLLLFYGSLCKM